MVFLFRGADFDVAKLAEYAAVGQRILEQHCYVQWMYFRVECEQDDGESLRYVMVLGFQTLYSNPSHLFRRESCTFDVGLCVAHFHPGTIPPRHLLVLHLPTNPHGIPNHVLALPPSF